MMDKYVHTHCNFGNSFNNGQGMFWSVNLRYNPFLFANILYQGDMGKKYSISYNNKDGEFTKYTPEDSADFKRNSKIFQMPQLF